MDYQLDRHIIGVVAPSRIGGAPHLDRATDGHGARVDTGADVDCQIELLQRAGMLKLEQR